MDTYVRTKLRGIETKGPSMSLCRLLCVLAAALCLAGCERGFLFEPVPAGAGPDRNVNVTIDRSLRAERQELNGVTVVARSARWNANQWFALLLANGGPRTLVIRKAAIGIEVPGLSIEEQTDPRFLGLFATYEGVHSDFRFLKEVFRSPSWGRLQPSEWEVQSAAVPAGHTVFCYLHEGWWLRRSPRRGQTVVLEVPLYPEDGAAEPLRFRFVFRRE